MVNFDNLIRNVFANCLLVKMQRGWNGKELKDFLVAQAQVDSVEWSGQRFSEGKVRIFA